MNRVSHNGAGPHRDLRRVLPAVDRRTGCDDWRVFLPSRDRRDCSVHFIESERFPTGRMALKVFHEQAVSPLRARRQFRRAQACHGRSTGEFTVPAPLFLLPRHNAIAMEYVDAPLLGQRLLRNAPIPGARARAIRNAARWLDWFYQDEGLGRSPFQPDLTLNRIEKLCGNIDRAAPGALAADRRLGDLPRLALEVAASLSGSLIPHAAAHGDFTPFNLFAPGRRMIGFDFGDTSRLPLYADMCRFLSYLNVYRPLPATAADLARYGCHGRDFDTFIEAFNPSLPFDADLWRKISFIETTRRILALKVPRPQLAGRYFRKLQANTLIRAAHCMGKALA